MTARMELNRGVAFYLALCMLLVAPLQGVSTLRAEIGVKTVMLGGLVGAGALFAVKAMMGPSSVLGAAGAAGTGVVAAVGSATGAVMSGVTSLASTLATGAWSLLSGVGSMLSSGLSAAASMVTQPWFLIPAAVIGGGLLVYHFYKKSKADSGTALDRPAKPGFFERWRMGAQARQFGAVPYGYGPVLPPPAYAGTLGAGAGSFYLGGPAAFASPLQTNLGGFGSPIVTAQEGTGVTGLGEPAPAGLPAADSLRAGFRQSQTGASLEVQEELSAAEKSRSEAYDRLVTALQTSPRASETAESNMADAAVQDAIRDYKAANERVQALRDRLSAR